jgi:hypothetical protein
LLALTIKMFSNGGALTRDTAVLLITLIEVLSLIAIKQK